jgi:hypothetical protein
VAIKAGQILHVGNQFLLDRLQTAGPGDLNIPTEKIYELGNRQSVAVVRDIPDLSFTADALDVSTEIEALLTGTNGDGTTAEETSPAVAPDEFGLDGVTGTGYNLADARPIDITSPWRTSNSGSNFAAVRGVVVPNLYLESAAYTYGLTDNAGESFTLRGDSIFYVPGHPYTQVEIGDGTKVLFPFTPANGAALLYVEQGKDLYALSVSVDSVRKLPGVDYTETATGVTFLVPPAAGTKVRLIYGTATAKDYSQAVHQGTAIKPAAIRGKDIQVFIGLGAGDLPFFWTGVQSLSVNWSVTLEDDFEFGNPRAVARDFADVPAVTGSLDIKPASVDDLFAKIRQIAGVTDPAQVVGPQSSVLLPLEIRLLNPESGGIPKDTDIPGGTAGTDMYQPGTVVKTLYIPDARFTLPGYSGQVQQKLVQTINFESDTGILEVFRGLRF